MAIHSFSIARERCRRERWRLWHLPKTRSFGTFLPGVGSRGSQTLPIGRSFGSVACGRHQFLTDATNPGLGQSLLKHPFRSTVVALAKLIMAATALRADKI